MSKTKVMINQCLSQASGSIRSALALAEEAPDPADTKARREDVLNQLLVLLNTSVGGKVNFWSRAMLEIQNLDICFVFDGDI